MGGRFDLERLERIVRSEIADDRVPTRSETYAQRWRGMRRAADESGSAWTRALGWLEQKARRVLHELRAWRRSG